MVYYDNGINSKCGLYEFFFYFAKLRSAWPPSVLWQTAFCTTSVCISSLLQQHVVYKKALPLGPPAVYLLQLLTGFTRKIVVSLKVDQHGKEFKILRHKSNCNKQIAEGKTRHKVILRHYLRKLKNWITSRRKTRYNDTKCLDKFIPRSHQFDRVRATVPSVSSNSTIPSGSPVWGIKALVIESGNNAEEDTV